MASTRPKTPQEKALWAGTKTGKYPAGTTAQTLTNIRDKEGWTGLHKAAENGFLPSGTTTQDLINAEWGGWTALHTTARLGTCPPETTFEQLATTKDEGGWTALHEAVGAGRCQPDFTAFDLAQVKCDKGMTTLHAAAESGRVPPDTTLQLLLETNDKFNSSAWDSLCIGINETPKQILSLPHHLFQNNTQLAITTIEAAIKAKPNLRNAATIWLGNTLAKAHEPQLAKHTR